MLRGYRSIVLAAVIGLAITAFGLGAYVTGVSYPKPERYQSYSNAKNEQDEAPSSVPAIAKPIKRSTPCQNPQTASESDLCAQWRAAVAAESTVDWTAMGVLASIAGIIGLYWQIALTREAVQDTGKATLAMERQNEMTQRMNSPQIDLKIQLSAGHNPHHRDLLEAHINPENHTPQPAFRAVVAECLCSIEGTLDRHPMLPDRRHSVKAADQAASR